jgi:hypothetical protein
LYEEDSQCAIESAKGRIDIDESGTTAEISHRRELPRLRAVNVDQSGPAEPQPAVPTWLIALAAVVVAPVVLALAVVIIALRPKARARRRAKRLQAAAQVTVHPRPGLIPAPTVDVPDLPGITIRIEPRLQRGEPFLQEVSR